MISRHWYVGQRLDPVGGSAPLLSLGVHLHAAPVEAQNDEVALVEIDPRADGEQVFNNRLESVERGLLALRADDEVVDLREQRAQRDVVHRRQHDFSSMINEAAGVGHVECRRSSRARSTKVVALEGHRVRLGYEQRVVHTGRCGPYGVLSDHQTALSESACARCAPAHPCAPPSHRVAPPLTPP